MRLSVIVCDLLVYMPACYIAARTHYSRVPWPRQFEATGLLLMQSALLIIDHGHFQYNGVCLGLCLYAVAAFATNRFHTAAILFSLALNFKQIALYFALPFFFALLSACWYSPDFWSLLPWSGSSAASHKRLAIDTSPLRMAMRGS